MSIELELIKDALTDDSMIGPLADWYGDMGMQEKSDDVRKYAQPRTSIDYQKVHIRWMIVRDMPDVLAISSSLENGWDEDEFLHCMRQRNCLGMVAEVGEQVVGYMIYELHKKCLGILTFAVHPRFRNKRVGRQMINKMWSKLRPCRRTHLTAEVKAIDIDVILFLKRYGFTSEIGPNGVTMTYLPKTYHKD